MALAKLKFAMLITVMLLLGMLTGIFGLILWYSVPGLSLYLSISLLVFFVLATTLIQWLIGPYIIKTFTRMREISIHDYPKLHKILDNLSKKAGIRKPRFYLVYDGAPNAFCFGWSKNNSFLAINTGLLNILNEDEVKAVMAHEVGHIKHWDFVLMTLVSMIPVLVYYLVVFVLSMIFRDRRQAGTGIAVFLGGMLAQLISQILVLYLSRTREYYADSFSAVITGKPVDLRTSLAKISYGYSPNSRIDSRLRSFYIADPVNSTRISRAVNEDKIRKEVEESEQKRLENPIIIKSEEIKHAMDWEKKNMAASFVEFFSTHPLTYKRLGYLDRIENEIKQGKLDISKV